MSALGQLQDVPIVTAIVAYNCPLTGKSVLLQFNQVLYIPDMKRMLMCPMQSRMSGIIIKDCPSFLAPEENHENHSIYLPDINMRVPLEIHGVCSYFSVRKPSEQELAKLPIQQMTAPFPLWDPHSGYFKQREEKYISSIKSQPSTYHINPIFISKLDTISTIKEPITTITGITSRRKLEIQASLLATRWNIDVKVAMATLKCTTQKGTNIPQNSDFISRRFDINDRYIRYKRLSSEMFTDTYFAQTPSRDGNKVVQLYCTDFNWVRVYNFQHESEIHFSLDFLFKKVGVPSLLISDNSKAQTLGSFKKKCLEARCDRKLINTYTPNQNRAEMEIKENKKSTRRTHDKHNIPNVLWDYTNAYHALLRSHTASNHPQLMNKVPETILTGETADISPLIGFRYWQIIKFLDRTKFPNSTETMGRWMGPAPYIGSHTTYNVIKENGEIIQTPFVRKLTDKEASNTEFLEQFASKLLENIKNSKVKHDGIFKDSETESYVPYFDDDMKEVEIPEADDYSTGDIDKYIGAKLHLPYGEIIQEAQIKCRKVNNQGKPVGKSNPNPFLDTRRYIVEFTDGGLQEYDVNSIAESIYAQINDDGHYVTLLDSIIDHRKLETAIEHKNAFYQTHTGQRRRKYTTIGWDLCCKWKDGSTSWVTLKEMKNSNPLETAEYAVSRRIETEPAFMWWVPRTLKKRNSIIGKVKSLHIKKTHKFGIEIPRSVEHALQLDAQNGNIFWRTAIDNEMGAVDPAFKDLENDEKLPHNYKYVHCHTVFDIKFDLTRKARFVANGKSTNPPVSSTYASVVARDTIRILFTIAALNDFDIMSADIKNAFVQAPVAEKVYTILGPEFGKERKGKVSIIIRALYGLKSAGASFQKHLADCMRKLHYFPCLADPNTWMKRVGDSHYEYVMIYVDDIISIACRPGDVLKRIGNFFHFKKPPEIPKEYLGAHISKIQLPSGGFAWTWSMSKYLQETLSNLNQWLLRYDMKVPQKCTSPFPHKYKPELDVSEELDDEGAKFYQSMIGSLIWLVEMGRLDINCEVSELSSFNANPRYGHFLALLHVFGYLNLTHPARLVLDPTWSEFEGDTVSNATWEEFYPNLKEAFPHNMPEPLGKPVKTKSYCDASWKGDKVSLRSRSGFILCINWSPIRWFSKKQSLVEASAFGAEFVAAKLCVEALRGLRYKIRMLGIPIHGPTSFYIDNQSVLKNISIPQSAMKRESNLIAYHYVREATAGAEILPGYINTDKNLADGQTKSIPSGQKRKYIHGRFLLNLY